MGANIALRDACDLGEAIVAGVNGVCIEGMVRLYERTMIPRGRAQVLESRAVGESDAAYDLSGGRLEKELQRVAGVQA
jgi:hypothetical protein